jgi:hypothetical protein
VFYATEAVSYTTGSGMASSVWRGIARCLLFPRADLRSAGVSSDSRRLGSVCGPRLIPSTGQGGRPAASARQRWLFAWIKEAILDRR